MELCEECALGHFADDTGSTACAPCFSGSVAPFTGSSACQECSTGTFAAHAFNDTLMQWNFMDSCEECAPGHFADSEGLSTCAPCFSGSVAPFTGSSACQECSTGTFAAHAFNDTSMQWNFMESCEECAPGHFAASRGQTHVVLARCKTHIQLLTTHFPTRECTETQCDRSKAHPRPVSCFSCEYEALPSPSWRTKQVICRNSCV